MKDELAYVFAPASLLMSTHYHFLGCFTFEYHPFSLPFAAVNATPPKAGRPRKTAVPCVKACVAEGHSRERGHWWLVHC